MFKTTAPNMKWTTDMIFYLLNIVIDEGFMTGEVPEHLRKELQPYWWEKVARRCKGKRIDTHRWPRGLARFCRRRRGRGFGLFHPVRIAFICLAATCGGVFVGTGRA